MARILTESMARAIFYGGSALFFLPFLALAVRGFLHTRSPVHYDTHASWITADHGDMAFYGPYVIINRTIIFHATPLLGGRLANGERAQVPGMWASWLMTVSKSSY
jgi:nitric oxide reductase subunit B